MIAASGANNRIMLGGNNLSSSGAVGYNLSNQNKFVTKRLPTSGIKLNPIAQQPNGGNNLNSSHISSYNSNFN